MCDNIVWLIKEKQWCQQNNKKSEKKREKKQNVQYQYINKMLKLSYK